MGQYSKRPSFKQTPLSSIITEFALALTAKRDDDFYPSGTAIVIGQYLAITAKHVIEDYYCRCENSGSMPTQGKRSLNFSINAIQVLKEGKAGALWNITRVWLSSWTDVAFLRLTPASKLAAEYKWRPPRIALLPPRVNSRVSGFGYASSNIHTRNLAEIDEVIWRTSPHTAIGEVLEIHERQRDRSRLNFPCFRTNARFDGGMSGGPVFDDMGRLCGIVCSNLAPERNGDEHVSYVGSLWPSMATPINLRREGFPPNETYAALELAKHGHISAEGWERIDLAKDACGNIVGARLNSADEQHFKEGVI